jgi:transcriptional regulator with XRE-family HTH domain
MLRPEFSHSEKADERRGDSQDLLGQIQSLVESYLKSHSHLSVNSLSKKCGVSEPTLRRILSGKVKTVPQVSTLLDILTYLDKTVSVRKIVSLHPGPIADYLRKAMPYLEEIDSEYSGRVNEELKDPVKYLIFKLALNSSGVLESKIQELYGTHGIKLLQEMVEAEIIVKTANGICRTKTKSYNSSSKDFVRNFKVVADFIKTNKFRNRKPYNPLHANCSESIHLDAYESIVRLQKKTQKKIRKILSDPENRGEIPFFQLVAIDTLDLKAAFEFDPEESASTSNTNPLK